MKKIISSIILLCFALAVNAQQNAVPDKVIYGQCSVADLTQAPYNKWFNTGLEAYVPDESAIGLIKKTGLKDIEIEVFFGTWCGDSQRELPRFLKVLSALSFPQNRLKLIALGGSDSLYKQGPHHEEAGKGLYRVPVFIINKNGREIGRINEFPVYSFEKDLYTILSGKAYTPNYSCFSFIHQWEKESVLTNQYTNMRSLANILMPHIQNEHLLNSVGNLFLKQRKLKEALSIFKINFMLYPESVIATTGLSKGFLKNNDTKSAIEYLEYALQLNKKPEDVKDILALLNEAKGLSH